MRIIATAGAAALLLAGVVAGAMAQEAGGSVGTHEATLMILTDADGLTLYTWAGDDPGTSNCSDACATAWPPAVVTEDPMTPPLGTIARDDGSLQLTWHDKPLYRQSGDTEPGETRGQGLTGFGALWHVVVVDARTMEALGL